MKKSVYKLNPESDRYRVCPNPECNKKHMVSHRGKDYCSDKCADDHYNQIRRLKNHAVAMLTKGGTISQIANEQQESRLHTTNVNTTQVGPLTEEQWLEAMKVNMEFLYELDIDPINGSQFWINEFVEKGFNFNAYSSTGDLYNYPRNKSGRYLIFQNYRMYCLENDSILIFNTNNLKTRNYD